MMNILGNQTESESYLQHRGHKQGKFYHTSKSCHTCLSLRKCLSFVKMNRLGWLLNNGKGFSIISKPTKRDGAHHLVFGSG